MATKKAKKANDPRAELEELVKATRARLETVDRILIEGERAKKAIRKSTPTKKAAPVQAPKLFSRAVMALVACAALVVGVVVGVMLH